MTPQSPITRQRGVITMFICIVMLLLCTVMVVTAFSLSSMNLKAVGNVQMRDEAIAAADLAIEDIITSGIFNQVSFYSTFPRTVSVDINNDGVDDYSVQVPVPVCVRAEQANTTTTSSVTLPGMSATSAWNTVWELDATAQASATGVSVQVLQGIRVLLSEVERNQVCA